MNWPDMPVKPPSPEELREIEREARHAALYFLFIVALMLIPGGR